MSSPPEPLKESSFENLLDGYYSFVNLENTYDKHKRTLQKDKEFISYVKEEIGNAIEERISETDYEEWLDLFNHLNFGEPNHHFEYNPFERTKYLLENRLVRETGEEFIEDWKVYEHYLEDFRNGNSIQEESIDLVN